MKKQSRLAGGVEPTMRLPRQLHMETTGIAGIGEGGDDGAEVNFPGPERKVVVPAGEHVVHMHVHHAAEPRTKGD